MKKSSLHLKKIWVFFGLVFVFCFGFLFCGLKVNAASNRYQVNVDSANCYLFFNLYAYKSDFTFIQDSNNNVVASFTYDSANDCYYLNNNTTYPFYDNQQYFLLYQNGINHYIFYHMEIPYNITSASDISIIQMQTISQSTQNIQYFYIDSRGFQFRVDLGSADESALKQTWFYRYNNSIYNVLRNQYGNYRYNSGYSSGYNTGYNEGQTGKTDLNKVWDIISGIFTVIGSVMAIELFPHVPIGVFFLVPLVFAAVGFIFWIYRRG